MRRIILIAICLVSLLGALASCDSKGKAEDKTAKSWRIIYSYNLIEAEKNGMFIAPGASPTEPLRFLDFASMQESIVCDDPTCKHRSAEVCPSFGKNNHPFIYNGKLFYFVNTDHYTDGDKLVQDVQLWESSINGRDESLLHTFVGLTYHEGSTMLLYGNTVYMCMTAAPHDADFNELEPSVRFMSYDLDKKQARDHGELASGYSCGGYIFGVWDNKVVLETWTARVNKPYIDRVTEFAESKNMTPDEAMKLYVDEYDTVYREFDITSGELCEAVLGDTVGVSPSYYYRNENDSLMYYDKDGKAHTIDGVSGIRFVSALDGYVTFNNGKITYLFDEHGNKLIKLNAYYDILALYDKDKVIICVVHEDGSSTFEKKAIAEITK